MIPFNRPAVVGNEKGYIRVAMENRKLSGGGRFTEKCELWLEERFECEKAFMTSSCTDALEMAALLADIQPGDEVIMPSFTFVSTANAFALRGAQIVFVDIRPDTMNIDETLIEDAITDKTKAIVVVHYAGISCEMDSIKETAEKHQLLVIEDAAQAIMSTYHGQPLGTIGDLGTYSFHETKNFTSGEGGAIIVNNRRFIERAEIISEKGTNRKEFSLGQTDKYTWVDLGSSFLPSELNAAYLLAQLEQADKITKNRLDSWDRYDERLAPLAEKGLIDVPHVPEGCGQNGHLYYIKTKDLQERNALIKHLQNQEIMAVFHYVPLHSSPAGKQYGRFHGEDRYTTTESERLLRLPMFYGLKKNNIDTITNQIGSFYG
ncbi:MAG TPA: dTDP-4-amino-4,6-dideoxygalactose transaminase [Bacillales bacterium]|nr:dTDP-4-amino-4,6-dideoxygalactose transaminase [Bacillales bacterium]